jgi:N6-L-threonylcarbamoyladenine synthase|tara:strand:+ start:3865 stop:4875 length:1011 start_codon:yes stop_codon:yes gene_type:complete
MNKDIIILGIESSCDDTSAAILKNNNVLSNIIANQEIHTKYGGVVPELASRAHQKNIVPVIHEALRIAKIDKSEIDAIAYTRGPGLMGSLLVGGSFAKGFSLALNKPLISVNHMQGHILSHFINNNLYNPPKFPFLCLTVSGGHTQIVLVKDFLDMSVIGQTIDDAAGEAFDKSAKVLGLDYPGGPLIDKFSKNGNINAFKFAKPKIKNLDFSFSGLKTSIMNLINNEKSKNSNFISENLEDLCASIQHSIVNILLEKIKLASLNTGIKNIAIAGGVSANSYLRDQLLKLNSFNVYIPKFEYCTDNAAMIAVAGYYKFLNKELGNLKETSSARLNF